MLEEMILYKSEYVSPMSKKILQPEIVELLTFDAWDVHYRFDKVLKHIGEVTENRKIYISFDIDVYDIPYVPCTGTPEPFGLNPFQVVDILKNIHDTAEFNRNGHSRSVCQERRL